MNKEIIVDLNELDKYLKKINSIFLTKNIINKNIDCDNIINYYRASSALYKYLHSYDGAVHMALNYDGIFNKKGYYTQLNEIFDLINVSEVKSVLELGCGKGFNSIFLAKKFPEIKFSGIDITDKHLKIAKRKSHHIENLKFTYGDFHKLDFEDSSFDFIFALESICYANDSRQVLSEIFRVLKNGGQFVLYDGFRQIGFESLPDNLVQAVILTEKSLAVNSFAKIDTWLEIAGKAGFKLKVKTDLSKAIMPNLGKLQLLARKYFEFPFLSKIFLQILPQDMMMNTIAVLLMPFTMHNKAHCYYKIVLEK
ncbi:MAG: class I SAM-dependent methyltransferase [Deltaproteobacteria bacterium]|nr:class I SAM-dependent methyltransferase [Deltaproteobacteria bacterium]